MICLPRGIPVRQKVNPARINLPEAMEKLRSGSFTGYLRFDSSQGAGVILFESGKLISSLFISHDETDRLIAYDAIAKIFEVSILGYAVLNIFRLSADLVLAVHALLHGRYLLKEKRLVDYDVSIPLQRIQNEAMTCCLRVYTEEQTTLIFYDQGCALGFFHDGRMELETEADLEKSVACSPEAKLDILEVRSTDDLALVDLMAKADLGPIWQQNRKRLMQERQQREEQAVRSQEQTKERHRQHLINIFKTIAGNHIGKFGVTQVEKAFGIIGPELNSGNVESFYAELQKLARLVASQAKITTMIDEMKREFDK